MRHQESRIQIACKRWFDYEYHDLAGLLFAVPNGGLRGAIEAKIMRAEGIVSGVSDMILLLPNKHYSALCIEFKSETGRQSANQKAWEKICTEKSRCRYVIVRSLNQFVEVISEYLRDA